MTASLAVISFSRDEQKVLQNASYYFGFYILYIFVSFLFVALFGSLNNQGDFLQVRRPKSYLFWVPMTSKVINDLKRKTQPKKKKKKGNSLPLTLIIIITSILLLLLPLNLPLDPLGLLGLIHLVHAGTHHPQTNLCCGRDSSLVELDGFLFE